MNLLAIILLGPPVIYAMVLFLFWLGLFRRQDPPKTSDQPKISIVIAARNEEKTLPHLLNDLQRQSYPGDRMEIIIANDHSTDGTAAIIQKIADQDDRFQCISVIATISGLTAKKNAMAQAISKATGEIILCTDADCRLLPTWAERMVSCFLPDVGAVIGFSRLEPAEKGFHLFQIMQSIDFLMLMTAAQGSANLGHAWAASGQNFAYRKAVYEEVGGFTKIGHRISGDDVLFLQLIRNLTKWKVRFTADAGARNQSRAEPSISDFFHQRIRWASNGAYQWKLNRLFFGYVINTFLTNLILLISVPVSLFLPQTLPLFLAGWLFKGLAEVCLFNKGSRIYDQRQLRPYFPLWFVAQIPYVVLVGLMGTTGGFIWKDRNHSVREQS
jgi:cellulose synthase/poly-beta-1,6-N-acetylglucosamine synthase-like glycosyltransferase